MRSSTVRAFPSPFARPDSVSLTLSLARSPGMILYTVLRMSALTVVGWMARDDDDDDSNEKQTRTDHDATAHTALYCLGQCLNAATGKVLKSVIAQERPRKMCLALRTCGEYGMPSSHSMVWAFFWVSSLVFDRSGLAGPSWVEGRRGDLGLVVGVVVVPVLRVVSGHHTIGQVTVGLVLGGLLGALWRKVVVDAACNRRRVTDT